MSDMLVRLYAIAETPELPGVTLRRALMPERHHVLRWVREHFSEAWVSECEGAFALRPVACVVALRGQELLGFAVYDSTALGVLGPLGVAESARGAGVGRALCVAVAQEMRSKGYQYGVIGWVGPAAFYERCLGATTIADSEPGMYRGMLR